MHLNLQKENFTLSTDPARLDIDAIHGFLSQSYWAKHRPRTLLEKAIQHSICFGVYNGKAQIGFARAITDYATFGYIADVYILEPYRGRGLARWLIKAILSHPDLKDLRRWLLTTRDAHKLYRECGFSQLNEPDHHMQRLQPYPGEESGLLSGLRRVARKMSRSKLTTSLLLLITLLCPACSGQKTETEASTPETKEKKDTPGENLVTIPTVTQKLITLKTMVLEAKTLPHEIKGYGRVLDITPLASLAAELIVAKAAAGASQAEVERLRTLTSQNNASQRALQTALAAAARDVAQAESARLRMLASWGANLSNREDLPALLQSLATLSSALLQISAAPDDVPEELPLSARVQTMAQESTTWRAKFISASPAVDPMTQAKSFLFLLEPNPGKLGAGSSLVAFLEFPGPVLTGILVPREALVRFEGGAWVYVQTGEETFRRSLVTLDVPLENGWFIQGTLKPGDQVVITGAQQLLSEELKSRESEE
jgi:GNAT superfamily N-acetyltransferase